MASCYSIDFLNALTTLSDYLNELALQQVPPITIKPDNIFNLTDSTKIASVSKLAPCNVGEGDLDTINTANTTYFNNLIQAAAEVVSILKRGARSSYSLTAYFAWHGSTETKQLLHCLSYMDNEKMFYIPKIIDQKTAELGAAFIEFLKATRDENVYVDMVNYRLGLLETRMQDFKKEKAIYDAHTPTMIAESNTYHAQMRVWDEKKKAFNTRIHTLNNTSNLNDVNAAVDEFKALNEALSSASFSSEIMSSVYMDHVSKKPLASDRTFQRWSVEAGHKWGMLINGTAQLKPINTAQEIAAKIDEGRLLIQRMAEKIQTLKPVVDQGRHTFFSNNAGATASSAKAEQYEKVDAIDTKYNDWIARLLKPAKKQKPVLHKNIDEQLPDDEAFINSVGSESNLSGTFASTKKTMNYLRRVKLADKFFGSLSSSDNKPDINDGYGLFNKYLKKRNNDYYYTDLAEFVITFLFRVIYYKTDYWQRREYVIELRDATLAYRNVSVFNEWDYDASLRTLRGVIDRGLKQQTGLMGNYTMFPARAATDAAPHPKSLQYTLGLFQQELDGIELSHYRAAPSQATTMGGNLPA